MHRNLQSCVQTGVWYEMCGGDAKADACFEFIKVCGFEAVDFYFGAHLPTDAIRTARLTDFYDADVESLLAHYRPVKAAAQERGIHFAQAHAPYPMAVPKHPEVLEYLISAVEKICAVCQMMECPALVVHPIVCADRKREWEENIAMYRRLMPAARKYGVTICLENMFSTEFTHKIGRACSNMNDVCRYIDTLNAEAGETLFGFCYDVGHANLTCNDIYEDIKTLGSRLTVLHIHGNDAMKDLHLIPYIARTTKKEHSTDWEGFIRGLREIGYQGPLNLESAGSLMKMPEALIMPLLKYASSVCDYFRKRITESSKVELGGERNE